MKRLLTFTVTFIAAFCAAQAQIPVVPDGSVAKGEGTVTEVDAVLVIESPCTTGWKHSASGAHKTACYPPNWKHMDMGRANLTGYCPPGYVHNGIDKKLVDGSVVYKTTYTPPLTHIETGGDKTKYQLDTNKWKHASVAGPCKTYYFPPNWVHIADGVNKSCYYPLSGKQAFDPVRENMAAAGYQLSPCVPNPASTQALIVYTIPKDDFVTMELYDERGGFVRMLVKEDKAKGTYELRTDVSDLPPGTYFYTMQAGVSTISDKMTVLR